MSNSRNAQCPTLVCIDSTIIDFTVLFLDRFAF